MPAKKKAAETAAPAKTTTRKTTRKPVPADTVVKTVNVYVKPEENKAYYVVNGEITGDIDL